MDAITEHLRDFNREYLSTAADRRRFGAAVLFWAGVMAIFFVIIYSRWPLWF